MNKALKIAGLGLIMVVGLSTTVINNKKYFEIIKNIEIFTNIFKELNTHYVDEIEPGELMRTGIDAMVESLDPYTNYISETDIEGYRLLTEGRKDGIGASMEIMGERIVITALKEGQAADEAGLKVGDEIIEIEGNEVTGKTLDEVRTFLGGAANTAVKVTVKRPGASKEEDIKLMRSEIKEKNVPYYGILEGDIGYVILTTFTREASRNIEKAIKDMKEENPNLKGLIFDLRGNGGGLLSEAVDICNLFVPRDELVVTTKGKVKEWDRTFNTRKNALDTDIPLAILINGRSASASEIVSGVVQDYDRGVLIGQRSYGKGLVQNTRDIGYNSKVKLTTAKYYIPSGRCIQSVEYDDGEPVDIDESKRAPFKTQNGRKVYDGGGVKPDIVTAKIEDIPIVKSLLDQHLIFDFVTDFVLKHEKIALVKDFDFTDYNSFLQFLKNRNFSYQNKSTELLTNLKEIASKEELNIQSDLTTLEAKIDATKEKELRDHKEDIIKIIEKEIASRYYYQNGEIQMGLKNDDEIKEAISYLRDDTSYKKVLTTID